MATCTCQLLGSDHINKLPLNSAMLPGQKEPVALSGSTEELAEAPREERDHGFCPFGGISGICLNQPIRPRAGRPIGTEERGADEKV